MVAAVALDVEQDAQPTSTWRGQLLSLVERATPRALSALLLLVMAATSSPRTVGIYAVGILVYTAYSAVSDGAMRQVIVVALEDGAAGARFMRRYQYATSVIGFAVLCGASALVAAMFSGVGWETFLALVPLSFAPGCRAQGIVAVGRLQVFGHWRTLANGQVVASIASVAASVPIVLTVSPIFGGCLQSVIAEAIFATWCRRRVDRVGADRPITPSTPPTPLTHQFASMSVYSGLEWAQTQSDRPFVGVMAGVARLGEFSIATALGRAVGDAIAASTANFLRADLRRARDEKAERARAERVLSSAVLLGVAAALVACAGAIVLRSLLPSTWDVTLMAMPIVGLVCVIAPLTWCGPVLLVRRGSTWAPLLAPLAGVALSPVIALGAVHDLRLAAWLLVLRELAVVVVGFSVAGRRAPWRMVAFAVAMIVVISPLAIATAY